MEASESDMTDERFAEEAEAPKRSQPVQERNTAMIAYDLRQPVSLDEAPAGSFCKWCGKPAIYQLTAVGDIHHNEEGFFCQTCGEEFTRTVADSLNRVITTDTTTFSTPGQASSMLS